MGIYYRKSPVDFYAFQFTEEASKNLDSWPSWARAAKAMGRLAFTDERNSGLAIKDAPKSEREHVVFGDWIVLDEGGIISLVASDIFAKTYESANKTNKTNSEIKFLVGILGDDKLEGYGITAPEIGKMLRTLMYGNGHCDEFIASVARRTRSQHR